MTIYIALIVIFWIIFYCYWLVSAFSTKKNKKRNWKWFGSRLLIFVLLYIFFSSVPSSWHAEHYFDLPKDPILNGLGVLFCALGIAFAIWARRHLGRNWGMPMSIKEEPELVDTGPYKYVRHPIYSGMLLAMVGSSLVIGLAWFVILIFCFIYFVYAATQEEKNMTNIFPTQYPEYIQRTKMLIPFIF